MIVISKHMYVTQSGASWLLADLRVNFGISALYSARARTWFIDDAATLHYFWEMHFFCFRFFFLLRA